MKRVLILAALLGCGRVQTVIRGSTSFLYASDEAPMHDNPERRDDVRLSVQWVGHATTIIEIDDRMILTDPALTATVGLLSKRVVKPGVESPPPVDLAVISHMHFDHLSYASLEELEDRIELCVLPEGAFPYLPNFKFEARTPKRWETLEHHGILVTSVPAAHGGWRYGFDASWATSSGGWVLERNGISVYFAGDTGYDEAMFKAIAKRFPSLDVALLPIAPMEPHKLMGAWHMNPEEAVRAFEVLGAKTMIPIHYDTFINSLDNPGEAIPTLMKAARAHKADGTNIAVLKIGERRVLIHR